MERRETDRWTVNCSYRLTSRLSRRSSTTDSPCNLFSLAQLHVAQFTLNTHCSDYFDMTIIMSSNLYGEDEQWGVMGALEGCIQCHWFRQRDRVTPCGYPGNPYIIGGVPKLNPCDNSWRPKVSVPSRGFLEPHVTIQGIMETPRSLKVQTKSQKYFYLLYPSTDGQIDSQRQSK